MKKIQFIFSIFLIFLSSVSVQAQLMVEDSRVELDVTPGSTVVKKMTLHNMSEDIKDVKIYWQDFEYIAPFKGEKKFSPGGTLAHSMANWISITPNAVRIEPKGSKDINYTINVPNTAEGGRYGVLFFEERLASNLDSTGVQLIMRTGTLVFIHFKNEKKQAEILNVQLTGNKFTGELKNTGKDIVFSEGTYYVMDKKGIVQDRGEIEKVYLPAQESVSFEWDMNKNLAIGSYDIILTFDLGRGASVVKEINIEKKNMEEIEIKNIRN